MDRVSITHALRDWQRFAELPPRALRQPYDDLIDYIGPAARQDIEDAARQLPPRQAWELLSLVEPWDDLYRSKSAHNPLADESRSWWLRRWND